MTYDYHVVFGILGILAGLAGFSLYFRSILKGFTKPHPVTWFIFVLIDGTVFLAQLFNGGGVGALVTGLSTALNAVVFIFALTRGEKQITKIDWVCLTLALGGIILWWLTSVALAGVLLASLADAIAKVPTIRKSYLRPNEESVTIWSFDLLKFGFSIPALTFVTLTTALFPVEILVTNSVVVGVVLLRRRALAARAKTG